MADSNSRFFFFSLSSLLFTTLALLQYPTASFAHTLFVFGDGYYDVGNKKFMSVNRVAANSPPYGMTVGKPTGRWSDGLTIPDFLAEFMNISKIPPILRKSENFIHGASFAIADATVLDPSRETMTLSQQVMKFSQYKNQWTDEAILEALYLTYIGTNDYLNFAKNHPNLSDDQKQDFVDQVITSVEDAIRVIYEVGGRKFAFQNLAPLGCLPVVKQEYGYKKECVKLPSEMAELHNKNLLKLMEKLTIDLKSFQYSVYNFSSSIQNRVLKPETYRFVTGTIACCGTGYLNGTGCATNTVCANPKKDVFFDGKHLTQEANHQVAQLMWSAVPEIIGPYNLRELLVFPLDITATTSEQEKIQSI